MSFQSRDLVCRIGETGYLLEVADVKDDEEERGTRTQLVRFWLDDCEKSNWFNAATFSLVHRPNSPSVQHRPIVIPCSSRKDGTRKWIVLADGWFRILSNEGESEWFCEENGPSVDLKRFYEFSRETKQELSQASDWAFVRIVCPTPSEQPSSNP